MEKGRKQQKSDYVIKESKHRGRETIQYLKERGLLDYSRKIIAERDVLWIPITDKIPEAQEKKLPRRKKKPQRRSLRERFGIRAFDIIGDIIVLFLPRELLEQQEVIVQHLFALYPNVKAIYKREGETEGPFRVQKKTLIAGQGSETIHCEYGLKFKLDICGVFFSPRQITQRLALIKNVDPGDKVCVFFSGIGVIPIYLAKYSPAESIVGIEWNEKAHSYAIENLELNKITERVTLIRGDVKTIVDQFGAKGKLFDLVIMAEPKNAPGFFAEAKRILRRKNARLITLFVGTKEQLRKKKEQLELEGFTVKVSYEKKRVGPKESRYTLIATPKNTR